MTAKELVIDFYQSDVLRNSVTLNRFLHDEVVLHWHSSKGFVKMTKSDLVNLSDEMNRAYHSSRIQFSHILQEDNSVSVHYTYYVTPIESPNEEMVLAHFMTIWEVKDGKLFRGYQMSQLS